MHMALGLTPHNTIIPYLSTMGASIDASGHSEL